MKPVLFFFFFACDSTIPLIAHAMSEPEMPPAAPSDLALSNDYYAIELTWDDNAADESGFIIYRQYEAEGFEAIDTLAANSENYSDRIPYGGTQYAYYVVAYNLAGESDSSNTETLTIGYRTLTQPPNSV